MTAPPALFAYAVTPDTVPYSDDPSAASVVTLMLTVNNATGREQPCERIVFQLPVGTAAADLTASAGTIVASPAQGTPWSISAGGDGSFTATPLASATGLDGGASIAFVLEGVVVNGLPGLAEITVYEDDSTVRQTQVGVSKVPSKLAITSFTANPVQVGVGQPATLAWTTTHADSCTLSSEGESGVVGVNDSTTVSPEATTVYTLAATGGGTTISQQLTIVVPQVQIVSFAATPDQVGRTGSSVLSWEVVNAESCVINPGPIPVDADSGSISVNPSSTTEYVLFASGAGTTASSSVFVNVEPPQLLSFTALPSTITEGESATVTWSTRWVLHPLVLAIDGRIQQVDPNGSLPVTPATDTQYQLMGVEDPPPTATIKVVPKSQAS